MPLPVFNFRVYFSPPAPEITALDQGDIGATVSALAAPIGAVGFAEVSGLNSELEIEEYREGGRNIGPRRFPKWGRYQNLVFRRGIASSTMLWDWWAAVISLSYTLPTTTAPPRRSGVILLEDVNHVALAGWFFVNALPERLVGPALNARSSEIAIEALELSHEGLLRLPTFNLPASV
jgi:phage tail-like protein